jgi:surfactin synthase thioesterase subunit
VPIDVYGGIDDAEVPPERLTGWSRQTSAGFTMQFFPGGHFFYKTALEPLLAQVAREVESAG